MIVFCFWPSRDEWLQALPRALVAGWSVTLLAGEILPFKLSNAGGRLVIASDGIWDALSSDMAAQSCRGLPAELAAKLVVKAGQRI
ncbi:hypothetical protein EZV62_006477 [Acer yangbiense]|uniref:PPM-type phosphatase domain-containing protein n=1 Tax=Acer yangbiense TaxID=1000413 RepID=A0A5C7I978_9ROSI|nr:hypothetical protein EZV62_006477 [Acer yangbiense]